MHDALFFGRSSIKPAGRKELSYMKTIKQKILQKSSLFSPFEKILWLASVSAITLAFVLIPGISPLYLAASLIGATSLIFCAIGHPFGQLMMIAFSLLYGWISLRFAYYGEMITYVFMTAPMALLSMITWIRHPYAKNQAAVAHMESKSWTYVLALSALITLIFFFLLKALHTSHLLLSTISIFTSFLAVSLTYRRSAWYAAGYAANDVVLIALWSLAALENQGYLALVLCFSIFLVNDLYGLFSWRRMERHQATAKPVQIEKAS